MAALMLASLLTGCSKKQQGGDAEKEDRPEFVYKADYIPLDCDADYINYGVYSGGKLYFTASAVSGTEKETDPISGEEWEYDVYETAIFSVNEDGTGLTRLEAYEPTPIPEGYEGDVSISNMSVDDAGNLWVLENVYTYRFNLPEDWVDPYADGGTTDDVMYPADDKWNYYEEGEQLYYLRKLASDGTEIQRIDISDLGQESDDGYGFYVNYALFDKHGNICISGDNCIYILDSNGKMVSNIKSDSWINSMFRLGDGRIAAMYYDDADGKSKIGVIADAEGVTDTAKGWEEEYDAPQNAYSFYNGTSQYSFYYSDDINFFGYDIKSGKATKILNWINCDVNAENITCITPLEDGSILGFYQDWEQAEQSVQLITMKKTDASQLTEKTVLTYACMYLDWNVRREILNFNRTNEKYRIEVKDYSEYNTADDYNAGFTKLTTEILTGNVPDIISTVSMPVSRMAAKGILEDLWPFIETDPELGGRDAVMSQVFSAFESDGKLNEIFPSFYVQTVVGAESVVGKEMGWTFDEFYETLQSMPEGTEIFGQGITKDTVLSYCCSVLLDGLVDWNTGKCSFDSEEFRDILKFTDLFPKDFDWENFDYESDYESDYARLSSGKQMLALDSIYDFASFQRYKVMFGGAATYKGFPGGEGNGSAIVQDGAGMAMSTSCKDKEGAWQFMRTFLTEKYQKDSSWSFPTNKKAFEEKMKDAMTPEYYTDPTTGETTEVAKDSMGWDDSYVEIFAMTQEEADQLMELIDTTTRAYTYDQSIYDIITEETAAYFSGARSADDTARNIQSKVSLYVNEQR